MAKNRYEPTGFGQKAEIKEPLERDLIRLRVLLPDGRYTLQGLFRERRHKAVGENSTVHVEVKDGRAWKAGWDITAIGPITKAVTAMGTEKPLCEEEGVLRPLESVERALARVPKATPLEELDLPLEDGMYVLSGGPFISQRVHGQTGEILASRIIESKAYACVKSGKQIPLEADRTRRSFDTIVDGDIVAAESLPLKRLDMDVGPITTISKPKSLPEPSPDAPTVAIGGKTFFVSETPAGYSLKTEWNDIRDVVCDLPEGDLSLNGRPITVEIRFSDYQRAQGQKTFSLRMQMSRLVAEVAYDQWLQMGAVEKKLPPFSVQTGVPAILEITYAQDPITNEPLKVWAAAVPDQYREEIALRRKYFRQPEQAVAAYEKALKFHAKHGAGAYIIPEGDEAKRLREIREWRSTIDLTRGD